MTHGCSGYVRMCLVVVMGFAGFAGFAVSDPAVCERSQASQISVSHSYFSGWSWCVAHLVWRDVCCLLTRLPARGALSLVLAGGWRGAELLSIVLTYRCCLPCLVTLSDLKFLFCYSYGSKNCI